MTLFLHGAWLAFNLSSAQTGAPLRVLASIFLVLILCRLIYLLRDLAGTRRNVSRSQLFPATTGPRNYLLLGVAAVALIGISLLLFRLVQL